MYLVVWCVPKGVLYAHDKTVTESLAQEDQPPLVDKIVGGASQPSLCLQPFGITKKWSDTALPLNRKEGIRIL